MKDIRIVRDEIKVQSVLGDLRKPNKPEEWDYFLDKKTGRGQDRLHPADEFQ